MVRDPVDRMISHYVEHVAQGIEHRAIETALAEPESRNMYLAASLYATQVRQSLDYFEESSLLILDQDELRDEPLPTLARVYRFLGVDESFRPPTPMFRSTHGRAAAVHRLRGRLRKRARRKPPSAGSGDCPRGWQSGSWARSSARSRPRSSGRPSIEG